MSADRSGRSSWSSARRAVAVATLAVVATACGSVAGEPGSDDGQLRVAVTTVVLGDVVADVVGEDGEVTVLMDGGQDPHSFELSAQQVAELGEMDLLVVNGLGLEASLADAIDQASDVPVVAVGEALDPLEAGHHPPDHDGVDDHADHTDAADDDPAHEDETEDAHHEDATEDAHHEDGTDGTGHEDSTDGTGHDDHADDVGHEDDAGEGHAGEDPPDAEHADDEHAGDDHAGDEHADDEHADDEGGDGDEHATGGATDGPAEGAHDDHDHGPLDPHVWLDVRRMTEAPAVVADALDEVADGPWQRRAATVADDLEALDAEIASAIAGIPDDCRRVATNHDVLGYFASRYGLEVPVTVIPGTSTEADPSAHDFAAGVEIVRESGVSVVVVEETSSSRLAEAFAQDAGSGVSVLRLPLAAPATGGPGSDGYAGMMRTIADGLVDALADCDGR